MRGKNLMYDKPYTENDGIKPDGRVYCMRCHDLVMDSTYKTMTKHNSPQETVNVYCPKKLSHYKLLPVYIGDNVTNSVYHLIFCESCSKIDIDLEGKIRIPQLICNAALEEAKWAGLPEEALEGIKKKYANLTVLRKLTAGEVGKLYGG